MIIMQGMTPLQRLLAVSSLQHLLVKVIAQTFEGDVGLQQQPGWWWRQLTSQTHPTTILWLKHVKIYLKHLTQNWDHLNYCRMRQPATPCGTPGICPWWWQTGAWKWRPRSTFPLPGIMGACAPVASPYCITTWKWSMKMENENAQYLRPIALIRAL